MKPITASKVIAVLERHGFILSRRKGSHTIWKHPQSGIIVPVPLHGRSKPIPIGTLKAIIKQSRIPPKQFR